MRKMTRTIVQLGIAAMALAAAPSFAQIVTGGSSGPGAAWTYIKGPSRAPGLTQQDLLGASAASDARVNRTVVIDPDTKYANVGHNETVKLVVKGAGGEQSFVWRFDGLNSVVNLSQIAPSAVAGKNVSIYVAPCSGPQAFHHTQSS